MKNATISINYDEEKLGALKLYLTQRGMNLDDEMSKSVDTLYSKYVPANVREFLDLKNGVGIAEPQEEIPKQKRARQKSTPEPKEDEISEPVEQEHGGISLV
jgi:hypothetical protein